MRLAIAAQESRRSREDLIASTPADGMVTGVGSVNGALFGPEHSRAVVMSYDATVLAGTQGKQNHAKTDRMLKLALAERLPVVLFHTLAPMERMAQPGFLPQVSRSIWMETPLARWHATSFRRASRLSVVLVMMVFLVG